MRKKKFNFFPSYILFGWLKFIRLIRNSIAVVGLWQKKKNLYKSYIDKILGYAFVLFFLKIFATIFFFIRYRRKINYINYNNTKLNLSPHVPFTSDIINFINHTRFNKTKNSFFSFPPFLYSPSKQSVIKYLNHSKINLLELIAPCLPLTLSLLRDADPLTFLAFLHKGPGRNNIFMKLPLKIVQKKQFYFQESFLPLEIT